MKREWTFSELYDNFNLSPEEQIWLSGKTEATQLRRAVLLKVFQYERRFPASERSIPHSIIEFMAEQLHISPADIEWTERGIREDRVVIRDYLGFRECSTHIPHPKVAGCIISVHALAPVFLPPESIPD